MTGNYTYKFDDYDSNDYSAMVDDAFELTQPREGFPELDSLCDLFEWKISSHSAGKVRCWI